MSRREGAAEQRGGQGAPDGAGGVAKKRSRRRSKSKSGREPAGQQETESRGRSHGTVRGVAAVEEQRGLGSEPCEGVSSAQPLRVSTPPAAGTWDYHESSRGPSGVVAEQKESTKPRTRRSRRGRRDEGVADRVDRVERGARGDSRAANARGGKGVEASLRWSVAPAPMPETVEPPAVSETAAAVWSASATAPTLKYPWLLSDAAYATPDPNTTVDLTPWEQEFGPVHVEGGLYNVVTVRVHRTGRVRQFDALDMLYEQGDEVAVEAEPSGMTTGIVVQTNRREVLKGKLPRVVHRVTSQCPAVDPQLIKREQQLLRISRHAANALKLPVKIVHVRIESNNKTVVFFACESRIDLRELYRRISASAQGRIELRQIGPRDTAKMLGGVAPCGLELCCTSFLKDFATVSIRMAKEQGLVLSPQRVSGLCGRLLCCLTYEDELYRCQRKLLPKIGKRVVTPQGAGKVRDVDVLSQTVRVLLESGEMLSVKAADITPAFPSQRQDDAGVHLHRDEYVEAALDEGQRAGSTRGRSVRGHTDAAGHAEPTLGLSNQAAEKRGARRRPRHNGLPASEGRPVMSSSSSRRLPVLLPQKQQHCQFMEDADDGVVVGSDDGGDGAGASDT